MSYTPETFGLDIDRAALSEGFTLLSSIVTVESQNTLSQSELCELSVVAWYEMQARIRELRISKKKQPGALTLLYSPRDRQIYLASSAKGGGNEQWLQQLPDHSSFRLLKRALMESGLDDSSDSLDSPSNHRRQASCGEMLTLHQWALQHADPNFLRLGGDCILSTVGMEFYQEESDPMSREKTLVVKRPCYAKEPSEREGCQVVLDHLQLDYLMSCREPAVSSRHGVTFSDHQNPSVFTGL